MIILLLFQTGGMVLYYNCQRAIVQEHMHALLDAGDTRFTRLTMSLADFRKCRVGNDEILLNGRMYDIRVVRVTPVNVELDAISDTDEDECNEKISLFTGRKKSAGNIPQTLIELLTLDYILPATYHYLCNRNLTADSFIPFTAPILVRSEKIPLPPPQLS